MSGRLVVHLGPHKTATSSIQWWLGHNAGQLARSGVQVARAGRNDLGHHDLAFALLRDATADAVALPDAPGPWTELRRELGEIDDGSCLVVSSENLAQLDDDHLARVAPWFEEVPTTLVVGVRDPVTLVPSLWQETVKWGRLWELPIAASELLHAGTSGVLPLIDRWRGITQQVDVVAFVVPGRRAGSSAVEAFAAAIGVPGSAIGELPSGLNRSLSFAHVEAIREVSQAIDPDDRDETLTERQRVTLELARQVDVDPQGARPSLPPESVAAAVEERRHTLAGLADRGVRLIGDPTALAAAETTYAPPTRADVAAVLEELRRRVAGSDAAPYLDAAIERSAGRSRWRTLGRWRSR